MDYGREVGVVVASAYRCSESDGGLLHVIFADGATTCAEFASFDVLCNWLRGRRSWAGLRSIEGGERF